MSLAEPAGVQLQRGLPGLGFRVSGFIAYILEGPVLQRLFWFRLLGLGHIGSGSKGGIWVLQGGV